MKPVCSNKSLTCIVPSVIAFLCACVTTARIFTLEQGGIFQHAVIFIVFLLYSLFALLLFRNFNTAPKQTEFLVFLILLQLTLLLRFSFFENITSDYTQFLARWVEYFRQNGGFFALKNQIGDYNVPYLYFLAAISYFSVPDLYAIKLVSIFFDLVLAFYAMKLTVIFRDSIVLRIAAFFAVLFAPTILTNGAYWGQCDTVYAAFSIMSLYYALKNRPWLAAAAISLAFSFKLQAIFLMPVFFVFLLCKKIEIRHLFVFPAVVAGVALPAFLFGKPAIDILSIYVNQIGSYSSRLTLNAPSIYAFFPSGISLDFWGKAGVISAFLFVIASFVYLYVRRQRVDNLMLLAVSLLFCAAIPFLLPHMHERYFIVADVLSLVYFLIHLDRPYIPILIIAASFCGYFEYLFGYFLYSLTIGALFMAGAIVLLLYHFFTDIRQDKTIRDG